MPFDGADYDVVTLHTADLHDLLELADRGRGVRDDCGEMFNRAYRAYVGALVRSGDAIETDLER